jgi:hypothetical protein
MLTPRFTKCQMRWSRLLVEGEFSVPLASYSRRSTNQGNSPEGNASKIQPSEGWAEDGLATVFTIRTVISDPSEPPSVTTSTTPTPTASSGTNDSAETTNSISVGAIAGIAIGGVALIALIGGGVFFCLRSRRSQRNRHQDQSLLEKDGLPSYSTAASMHRAELVGTPQAAELSAKQNGHDSNNKPPPVEKDAGNVHGSYPSNRQPAPIEME